MASQKATYNRQIFYLSILGASLPPGIVAVNYGMTATIATGLITGLLVVGINKFFAT